MGVNPTIVGNYGKPWTIPLNTDSGPDDLGTLTTASIAIIIKNLSSLVEVTSTGGLTIVTAKPAVITWQPTSTDVAVIGNYHVIPQVTFGTGPIRYDPIFWNITTD